MGRVDDALRRAGAGQPDQQPGSRADAVALSREPFPSEGPPTSEELFPVAESTSETMVTAAEQMVLQEGATTDATPPAAELHLHVPPPDAEPSAGEAVPAASKR